MKQRPGGVEACGKNKFKVLVAQQIDWRPIRYIRHPALAFLAGLPAALLGRHHLGVDREARRHPLEDSDDRLTVAFT